MQNEKGVHERWRFVNMQQDKGTNASYLGVGGTIRVNHRLLHGLQHTKEKWKLHQADADEHKGTAPGERDGAEEPSVQQKPLAAGIASSNKTTFDNYIGGKRQTKEFITS